MSTSGRRLGARPCRSITHDPPSHGPGVPVRHAVVPPAQTPHHRSPGRVFEADELSAIQFGDSYADHQHVLWDIDPDVLG